ncbi:regulator of nonsense transcripts 2 [Condylostylus longicornis]|uniref:regulator of nonsense transcripts 2 n=1 Tax=Condylostylus longicornis TaxID=2530218 RepID=UPI00244DA841|nr:regulator of nonsense transcripts 2 [Condylostylus longicornis]
MGIESNTKELEESKAEESLENEKEIEKKEIEEIENFIKDLETKIQFKENLRSENIKCVLPSENSFSRLDSSLKKNTAFVKKLKQFTALQLDGLLKDMAGLNLSKYISEICVSLSEAKLKMTDVQAVVSLTSKLHQTYSDFDQQFLESWQKILAIKSGEKITNPSKLRVDLRLFAELVSSGVINGKQGLSLLGNALTNIISQTKDDHSNLSIILSFCRHCGEEYAGLIPKHILDISKKHDKTIPKSNFLTPEKQTNLKNLLKDYYKTLINHLLCEHKELMAITKSFRNVMKSKGEISNEGKEKCELMQANFDKLYNSAVTLSDLLNENMPELPKDRETGSSEIVLDTLIEDQFSGELDPWGDEDTKIFYCDLPDLRQFLPNFCAPKQDLIAVEEENALSEEALDMDIEPEQLEVDDPPSNSSDLPAEKEETSETCEEENKNPPSAPAVTNHTERINTKANFDNFLNNLNNCVNTELIDSAAIEFLLNFNTKNNRKKLTKALFGVQRTRLDLLPFLSRFTAIINMVNRDVAVDLAHMLKSEFKWHIQKKNQMNIESKIKIIRFIGEMTKFGLYSKIESLFCLKVLLHDFQHHQIEMACAFIEVAGIYLYNCRDTRLRMNVYLEQMNRLKTNTALDSRHAAQVESVYYLVKPPESIEKEKVQRPILHEYIRHLIFEELCSSNVDKSIKLMRRLNWDNPEVSSYAIKCLSKAYLLRFPLIRCLADLVSGLSSYQEKAVTKVIDNVFEDIRAGLEIHAPKLAQRRIAMAKYLGELYNYKLVDSTNILNTLYSIISLGVSTEEGVISPLDPPDSLFRLKLACVLLDTSGQYFTSSVSRKRLDYFLVFFQHYYWYKKSNPIFSQENNSSDLFPILIDHMYRDCLLNVKPKLKLIKSFDQAKEEVDKLKAEVYPQLLANNQDGAGDNEVNNSLPPIKEDGELDEMTEDNTSDAYAESDDDIRNTNLDEDEGGDEGLREASPIEDLLEDNTSRQPTAEDLEFEEMFEKMTAESYQERLRDSIKPTTKDIPVPMMAKSSKKTYEQLQSGNKLGGSSNSSSDINKDQKAKDGVSFVLMMRSAKGGKQQFKTFNAPVDSDLAVNLKLQEQKIREENEKVKRLTLNITERIEEEDYQESLLQQKNQLQNRFQKNRQAKFKHQKGAPDADLIFN